MNAYLKKYGFQAPKIKLPPSKNLRIIIVIPCFNEPDLISSLQALNSAEQASCDVEVIVVLNSGEDHSNEIKRQNQQTAAAFAQLVDQLESHIQYHLIHESNLPKKHAGVGLARKIGMDEAVARFEQLGEDGIIVCFDADAGCDKNYLKAIESHFQHHKQSPGAAIYFEHPLAGQDHDGKIYEAITSYELHLRYYVACQRYLKLPYAFHTVGSSMAVRSSAYKKQGGMNKRKAGEDFYFLHKIIALGNFSEINTTKVIPSPRVSDRVPFGTGKAVGDRIADDKDPYVTYNFEIFKKIESSLRHLSEWYQEDFTVVDLPGLDREKLLEIKSHTSSYVSFIKRFYVWFDAFRLLKVVHHFRDNGYPNQPIQDMVKKMGDEIGIDLMMSEKEQLKKLRAIQRTELYQFEFPQD